MRKIIILSGLLFCLNGKAQLITTIAGNGTTGSMGDGGQATAAMLDNPGGIAIDANGNIYISDYNKIRKINPAGIITTFAGNGTAGFSGDGGQATAAKINTPQGLATDALGNLYIADNGNNRIRKVSSSGIISTVAGNGSSGYAGDFGQATSAMLALPTGVAVDASSNIYIADWNNHRVRKINSSGIIKTVAGNGVQGYNGDNGVATSSKLAYPSSIALDNLGNLYIADEGNFRVRKVNSSGIITTLAGHDTIRINNHVTASTIANLTQPWGVAVDYKGSIFISENTGNDVKLVDTSGTISIFAGTGTSGYSGDGGLATLARLGTINHIAFDALYNLYIVDMSNNRVRKVAASCNVTPVVSYTLIQDVVPYTWDAYPTYSANTTSVRWYWGDGSSTTAMYPSHTYSAAGTYSICVTAYSSCGDSTVYCQRDSIYRLANNNTLSNMIYVNVKNTTTGIGQLAVNNNQITVYPNPSNGLIQVTAGNIQISELMVNDVTGKLVLRQSLSKLSIEGNSISVDLSNLQNGIYSLSIISNAGKVNKRIVIAK